jgi:hypothetical protein
MNYITPSTNDFTKTSEPWRLEPNENESYDIQAVEMTFDADILQTSDIVVSFYNYNIETPLKQVRYSSFLDWIRKSTEHTKIEGVHNKVIHKFYMNFSQQVTLYNKNINGDALNYMTVSIDDNTKLKDKDGNDCDIAIGEYIINVQRY